MNLLLCVSATAAALPPSNIQICRGREVEVPQYVLSFRRLFPRSGRDDQVARTWELEAANPAFDVSHLLVQRSKVPASAPQRGVGGGLFSVCEVRGRLEWEVRLLARTRGTRRTGGASSWVRVERAWSRKPLRSREVQGCWRHAGPRLSVSASGTVCQLRRGVALMISQVDVSTSVCLVSRSQRQFMQTPCP